MKTTQIHTNLYCVAISENNVHEYIGETRLFVTDKTEAELFDEEDADLLVETYEAIYPNATVRKEAVKETLTTDQLAETIADIYNGRTAGWDYQHCGWSSDYSEVTEMCNKLDKTLFCAEDIKHAIERDIDNVNELEDYMTIDAWAEFVADPVAQRITQNLYQDVTFIVTLKK